MKRLCGVGLLLLVMGHLPAEPPKQARALTPDEQKEVARLDREVGFHALAGHFEDAAKAARRIVEYRAERQGTSHWQVIDARLTAERWQRLTTVKALDRPEVLRALLTSGEGNQLEQQRRHGEAERKLRQAVAIYRTVLGAQHPYTADGYNNLAGCLESQGKITEAIFLHQQALEIRRKHLGEQHADTATSCNNLAVCIEGQGKHAAALALFHKALAIRLKALGEQHPLTGVSYNNVAACLDRQGKYAEALPDYQKALTLFRKVLGEQHIHTAGGYNNLAFCLSKQGKHGEALPLLQKALAIRLRLLGEQHPLTALSYNNVAGCLNEQARYAEAVPLHRKALALRLKVLGEQHPDTATSYNNVADCLESLGQPVEALPLFHKALAIRLKRWGEQHPDTAASYNNVAACLQRQGKYAEALPLYQKALAINRKVLTERHPTTATSYNNVAACLQAQGRHAGALPLYQKALALRLQTLGEQHLETATSYNNVAFCLYNQGKHAEALPLFQKALAIFRKMLGEQHPSTALGYGNVASCLKSQGKHAEALPLFHKALAIYLKVLGEHHPSTAQSFDRLANCLNEQGKYEEAAHYWEKALAGYEYGRLQISSSGFERALFQVGVVSPHASLAACLVRLGKTRQAWQHAEADFARGLLDDLLPSAENSAEAAKRDRVRQLGRVLLPLLGLERPSAEQIKQRAAVVKERDALLAELAAAAARRSRERVLALPRIRKQLPPDAALVFWLDRSGEHLGCVLRHQGPPVWVRLPGSGQDNTWTREDDYLPTLAYFSLLTETLREQDRETLLRLAPENDRELIRRAFARGQRQPLQKALHRQRLAPLEPHLKGVRRLLIVPAGEMAAMPVEALTERYTISYVPSASIFARQAEQHRPLQASPLLVLADPAFRRLPPKRPAAPPQGLLIRTLTPGSLAARVGLRPGDVLLEYNGKQLSTPADLQYPEGSDRVPVKLWREGQTLSGRIPAGKLGVIVDNRPLTEALVAWRQRESDLLKLGRGNDWQPLPGTRLEARALSALVPKTMALLGSEASQQKLAELAAADRLKSFRLLHLATHGQANSTLPRETALILAQDRIDDTATAQAVLAGQRPVDGRLTVGTILAEWQLDADLVVLSACQTGLGKYGGGEGMLGFTQALLLKGARSVVLARWKVDDAATALLMTRFYENLLGARKGTKPLGRAAALTEAKAWLRGLSRDEATRRLAALVDGVPRGERGSIKAALPTRKPDAPRGDDRPFASPYYWAAFVLIGDPD